MKAPRFPSRHHDRTRWLVRCTMAVGLFILLGPTPWADVAPPPVDHRQLLSATAVVYPQTAGAVRTVGALDYREGWVLESNYTGFGGFSGMAMLGPRRFLLAADTGLLTGFTLSPEGKITHPFIAPVPDGPGDPRDKFNRDMESLTASSDGTTFWVGFEHTNAIWKYRTAFSVVSGSSYPPLMHDWPDNGGAEAMTRLADGRFLVFSESAGDDPRGFAAILFLGDPTEAPDAAIPFFYDPQGKGKPTDAVQLPDGRILILHRKLSIWEGFRSSIAIADIRGIEKDTVLHSQTIAEIAPPNIAENFEGMTLEREGQEWMLWMISDNNQNHYQRTLLVKYRIKPELLEPPDAGLGQ